MTSHHVLRIDGVIRRYAWGSREAIPDLLGVEPTDEPAAELWLGAHPDDPALVADLGTTLDKLLATDPERLLGTATLNRFGPRLPFLLKILAAGRALSLQVHPSLAQAQAGYAAQQNAPVGADPGQPHNYMDDNHKPELLCALTPFAAFCGFRSVPQTLELLEALRGALVDLPNGVSSAFGELAGLLQLSDGLRAGFTWLLRLNPPQGRAFVEQVVQAATVLARSDGPWQALGAALVEVNADFPGDIGIAVGLLLNFVELQPGEALYLGAGNVHAYLRGTGVEIMANSDNVLRCGLTGKHIDVDELLAITDFSVLVEPRWQPMSDSVSRTFTVPVPDFELVELSLDESEVDLEPGLPSILIVTDGAVTVTGTSEEPIRLNRGQAAFIAADSRARLDGSGTVFRALPGLHLPVG